MYKYEYIPDKRMYAAVMGACKYIRETGFFNKAIQYYSDKFDVNYDDLKQYVTNRSIAGRKSIKREPKKLKYFIIETHTYCEADYTGTTQYNVAKGATSKNVQSRLNQQDFEFDKRNDYGGVYARCRSSKVIAEFDKKEDAINKCLELRKGLS